MNIPIKQIELFVNKFHVSAPPDYIEKKIREKIKRQIAKNPNSGWNENSIKRACAYAVKIHKNNGDLYSDILRGNI